MIQRFFFDRVNSKPCCITVRCQDYFSVEILSDMAETSLSFFENTASRAYFAFKSIIFQGALIFHKTYYN